MFSHCVAALCCFSQFEFRGNGNGEIAVSMMGRLKESVSVVFVFVFGWLSVLLVVVRIGLDARTTASDAVVLLDL